MVLKLNRRELTASHPYALYDMKLIILQPHLWMELTRRNRTRSWLGRRRKCRRGSVTHGIKLSLLTWKNNAKSSIFLPLTYSECENVPAVLEKGRFNLKNWTKRQNIVKVDAKNIRKSDLLFAIVYNDLADDYLQYLTPT